MTLGKIVVAILCVHTSFAAITDREEWDKRFYTFTGPFLVGAGSGGAPGPIAVYRDGEFLIGGRFTNLTDTPLLNFAKWDGTNWTKPFASDTSAGDQAGEIHIAFTSQIDSANGIHSIATRQVMPQGTVEVLISGAGLTNAGGVTISNVAWWTGSQWNELGGGTTGLVSRVLFDANGAIIAGGNFTSIGGITATNVARYNGTVWESLADGLPFVPTALVLHDGQVHAAGHVATQDGTHALLLRWSGTEWLPVGTALNGVAGARISALLSRAEGLLVGGAFTNIGGIDIRDIALWTGTEWQPLGEGLSVRVESLAEYQGDILAVGAFYGSIQRGIASWNGANWNFNTNTPLRFGKTMAVSGDRILARGQVNTGLDDVLNGAAYFDGETWKPLGQGANPGVFAVDNSRRRILFVSDERGVNLGVTHNYFDRGQITRWNGEIWEHVGELLRFPASVDAFDLQGDNYWVGTMAIWNIPPVSSIAVTGETNWIPTGSAFGANAIVIAGTKVYAGASRGNSGLFEWNGTQFSKVTNYTNAVLSLATDGNNLYVAGRNLNHHSISRFDGQNWTELATIARVSPRFELHFVNGSLFVSGGFTNIADVPIKGLGRWDGQLWQPVLPDDLNLNVFALAGDGRDSLYVGGFRPGSQTNLYQVRGDSVLPVDAPAAVEALHWWRGALYVAGDFSSIQSVPSQSVAAWHDSEAAVEVIVSAPTNTVSGTEAELTLHVANVRTNTLSNVVLTMPVPPGATPVNLSPNMSLEAGNIVWQLATLESGLTNLNASLRLQGTPGTNFAFEVWASGPDIPTFRSSPTATTLAAPPELHVEVLGRNSDGSWRLSWTGDATAEWIVLKSHDLVSWEPQPIESREGQVPNEFTIPASAESRTFWKIAIPSPTP